VSWWDNTRFNIAGYYHSKFIMPSMLSFIEQFPTIWISHLEITMCTQHEGLTAIRVDGEYKSHSSKPLNIRGRWHGKYYYRDVEKEYAKIIIFINFGALSFPIRNTYGGVTMIVRDERELVFWILTHELSHHYFRQITPHYRHQHFYRCHDAEEACERNTANIFNKWKQRKMRFYSETDRREI
jgi:hypothetical protein